jgi:hypothetical protein
MTPKTAKIRHCFSCGAEIGAYADHDRLDTCGSIDCDRVARDILAEERAEAHDRLDDDMGWR